MVMKVLFDRDVIDRLFFGPRNETVLERWSSHPLTLKSPNSCMGWKKPAYCKAGIKRGR